MKIAILGAAGRMGQALLKHSTTQFDMEVLAAIEQADHPLVGSPVKVDGLHQMLIYTNGWNREAESIIDFSFHAAVPGNIARAVENGQSYVLGTTGLTSEEEGAVNEAARKIPIVWSANMGLGINVLLELVRRSAEILGPEYDVEITELHHRMKRDAPSGTAIALAQKVAEGRGVKLDNEACFGRRGLVGERPQGEIAMHALRGGSVVGDHTVMFLSNEERIELTHKAQSRESFAKGAFLAARWLGGKEPGLYTMRHVLGFDKV